MDNSKTKISLAELLAWLESQGWKPGSVKPYDSFHYVWYRRYSEVTPNCYGNSDKPGMQVALRCWDFNVHGIGFEVEIVAEPDDGVWVRLIAYTLSDEDLVDKLDAQVEKLIRAWKACQLAWSI